ncbi:DNA polymerase III subunit chi [Erythrobacter sp. JK5]|uniref:DNA polymerase III subunit chi n=1 Tax=Erythrobacter sp. JK5 TaxID=2829500 RepID=UPI001BAB2483|nr:DNA polymerase III subunit chi [Erythrobacter sp. JK5]QUL38243.1 DNA polymerase III subunit chi [Erythrobacter sp. JK5]
MKVDFWQLSNDPVEKVVALIAQRVLDSGERLLVVSADPDQREAISRGLWNSGPESFLAHGDAAGAQPEAQPILLSDSPEPANRASHVIYADGAWRDAPGFARSFLLFDAATLEQARATWRSLDGTDDLERSFYRQDGGKWVKVA